MISSRGELAATMYSIPRDAYLLVAQLLSRLSLGVPQMAFPVERGGMRRPSLTTDMCLLWKARSRSLLQA